jgi:plastocyanin
MKRPLTLGFATTALVAALVVPSVAATRSVSIRDDYYSPRSVSVSKNTTVRWVWRGSGRHNVVVGRGPATFRSPLKRTGTYSHKFTRRGTYRIVCTVHEEMTMSVRVT